VGPAVHPRLTALRHGHDDDAAKSGGYWLGVTLMLVGAFGAIVWLVVLFAGIGFDVDGWLRIGIPSESATVQLEARKYVVYESPTAASEEVPAFRVQVFDAQTGAEVPVAPYNGSFTYDFGRQGSAEGSFTAPRKGFYRIVTTIEGPTPNANIALGDSVGSVGADIFRAVGGSIAIGTIFGLAGLLLVVVSAVRRSRARRAPPAAPAWSAAQSA
jgi:hypothetical protein